MACASANEEDDRHHHQERHNRCFRDWNTLQQGDLSEILESLALNCNSHGHSSLHEQLIEKNIRQEYAENRLRLANYDVSAFLALAWCSSLENSMLWIVGCRPSMYIRLVYMLCSSEFKANLSAFRGEHRSTWEFGRPLFTAALWDQSIAGYKTIKEEEKLTSKLASLQEDIVDQPIATIARRATQITDPNREVDRTLDEHERSMLLIMEAADKLRLDTLKELIEMVTPPQAIEFLAAGKKLHLCIREWAKKRDHRLGRNRGE